MQSEMTKIYISSTYSDLKDYRDAAHRQLRRMENIEVVAMENYVAADQRPLDKCLSDVKRCDVYVGLFAHRYGYIPTENNSEAKSITELEYLHAVENKKYVLIFLLAENVLWDLDHTDYRTGEGDRGQRIEVLRQELAQRKLVSFFRNPDELASLVGTAIANFREKSGTASVPKPPLDTPDIAVAQPREVTRQLFLACIDVDKHFAQQLLEQLRPRGLNALLSFRALYTELPFEFMELERSLRTCDAAAVLLSDHALQQLEEQRDRTDRILEMISARTGEVIGWCCSARALQRANDLGFSRAFDVSDWQPGKPPSIDLLEETDRLVALHNHESGARIVGLPFVVFAMTRIEASDLAAQPGQIDDQLGHAAFKQFTELESAIAPPFAERYGDRREDWRPFFDQNASADKILKQVVFNLNHPHQPLLRGRTIKIQYYPFNTLLDESQVLGPVYREIANTGCVLIVDELSLYHPRLRAALLGSPFFGNEQVAVVTISPLNPYQQPPYSVMEKELQSRLAAAYSRFADDYDPQCEFSVGDERRLTRWLFSSLPQTIQTLREPQPDRQKLNAFADELGREPSQRVAGLLYSEGGLL